MRARALGLAVLAGLLFASACAVPRPGVQGLNNASAEVAIKSRMLRSERNFGGVDVTVVDGVALLTGHVPTQADKDEAARIAWSAPNVRDVGDELVVSPDGRRLLGANDQLLLSQVRARLVAARDIRSDRIHLEVYDGVVYLLGRAGSAAEAEAAAREASVTPGVKRVVSFLSADVPGVGAPRNAAPFSPPVQGGYGPADVSATPLGPAG
jgi:osmotically-inducible protein OsmY